MRCCPDTPRLDNDINPEGCINALPWIHRSEPSSTQSAHSRSAKSPNQKHVWARRKTRDAFIAGGCHVYGTITAVTSTGRSAAERVWMADRCSTACGASPVDKFGARNERVSRNGKIQRSAMSQRSNEKCLHYGKNIRAISAVAVWAHARSLNRADAVNASGTETPSPGNPA